MTRWAQVALLALGIPAGADGRIINLAVYGDDTVCATRVQASHSVDLAVAIGCHYGPYNGLWPTYTLYRWADDRFVPAHIPYDTRSISADARYAVSGPGAMQGLTSQVLLHDLALSTSTVIAVGAFSPLLTADGSAVLYGDTTGYRILRWDRITGERSVVTNATAHLRAASADGTVVAVSGANPPRLYGVAIIDTVAGNTDVLCTDAYDESCFLGLSPDARWLVYRPRLPDDSRERRLRDRTSGQEWLIPDEPAYYRPLRVVFDQASRRMLFARPWGSCGYSLFVRDLATFVDRPVAVESPCPARGSPSAFGSDDRVAISGNYVASLDVLFVNGAEAGVVDWMVPME